MPRAQNERKAIMSINSLSKEHKEILSLVSNFKCVDIYQLYELYNFIKPNTEEKVNMIVSILESKKYLQILNGRYLVPIEKNASINNEAVSCIWTMLKLRNDKDDVVKAYEAAEPAFAFMTVANKESYELAYINAEETVKLRAVMEKIERYAKEPLFASKFVFVATDPAVIDLIKKATFADTVWIALLDYDKETKIPTIQIKKKTAKKTSE